LSLNHVPNRWPAAVAPLPLEPPAADFDTAASAVATVPIDGVTELDGAPEAAPNIISVMELTTVAIAILPLISYLLSIRS
jgi:hypothetical protein